MPLGGPALQVCWPSFVAVQGVGVPSTVHREIVDSRSLMCYDRPYTGAEIDSSTERFG